VSKLIAQLGYLHYYSNPAGAFVTREIKVLLQHYPLRGKGYYYNLDLKHGKIFNG